MLQVEKQKPRKKSKTKRICINETQKRLQGVTYSLSDKYYWYLVSGKWSQSNFIDEEGKPDKSKIEYSIIYRLVCMRYDKETIRKVFEAFAYNGAYYWLKKGVPINGEGHNWFDYEILQANTNYNINRNHDFDYPADTILEHYKYLPILSSSLKSTFLAIVTICKEIGSFNTVCLPVRRVAVKAGCSKDTAYNHIEKLCKGSWKNKNGKIIEFPFMEKIKNSTGYKSAIYNVFGHKIAAVLVDGAEKGKLDEPTFDPFNSMANHSNLDEYYYNNLGKSGKAVVDVFLDNLNLKFSIDELCNKLRISRPTVNKKLKELVKGGYIYSEKEKTTKRDRSVFWMKNVPIDMKAIISAGTEGINNKRKENYEEESILFKNKYINN